jgi:tRNA A-37 threonylcarbamoyl transferase component Bud32
MIEQYSIIKELGKGKEGRVYSVRDPKGHIYALKQFNSRKSPAMIRKEATLQQKAYTAGIAPRVISIDTINKFIVMEELDMQLITVLTKTKGILTRTQQFEILNLFKKLDDALIFHADPNISNYMIHRGKMMMIDYGMSKDITSTLVKKLKTNKPNSTFMAISFIIKLKEGGCPSKSYNIIEQSLLKDTTVLGRSR